MSVHIHRLSGCRPAPLALYLKALGILRIVSEQKDNTARGWWQDEEFCLMTKLSREELEQFFLHEYSPTPFLSPWNKGCGFFKANDKGLVPLERSKADRFASFREGIEEARELLDEVSRADAAIRAIKDRTKTNKSFQSPEQREHLRHSVAYRSTLRTLNDALKKDGISADETASLHSEIGTLELLISDADKPPTKAQAENLKKQDGYKRVLRQAEKRFKTLKDVDLIPNCRRLWRGRHGEWLASALVIRDEGDAKFPALLGTGGNDSNLDFTNNAMQRLGELFDLTSADGTPHANSQSLLQSSLWGTLSHGLASAKVGQFDPGSAGGANTGNEPQGNALIEPWGFILMLEGAVLFTPVASRRLDHELVSRSAANASAPFSVRATVGGYTSAGDEPAKRGEQWMPIWRQPVSLAELDGFISDGRLRLGRHEAERSLDAVRAIKRLGGATGIESFVRFAFLQRYGDMQYAVPVGRVTVKENKCVDLIDDLSQWMEKLRRIAHERDAKGNRRSPARLIHTERRLADAVFAALTHDYTASRWRLILEAAADIEAIQAAGTAFSAGPMPKLKPAWVSAIYDASDDTSAREVRLALSLASGTWKDKRNYWSVRHHFLPLEPGGWKFKTTDKRLADDPQVVATGRDAISDCGAIVLRRFIDSPDDAGGYFPLKGATKCGAALPDLAALIDGHVDLQRVVKLARALMAIDWRQWNRSGNEHAPRFPGGNNHPDEAWLAIRLACLPWKLGDFEIKAEHTMVRRLLAGDGTAAANIANRRLRSCGLRVPFDAVISDDDTAARWAAALAFPVSQSTARRAANILNPKTFGDPNA